MTSAGVQAIDRPEGFCSVRGRSSKSAADNAVPLRGSNVADKCLSLGGRDAK